MCSLVGDAVHHCVYRTEEDWGSECWSDIFTESDSENDKCDFNSEHTPYFLRKHCFDHAWSKRKVSNLESRFSTTTSKGNDDCSHEVNPGFQAEALEGAQQNVKKSKKACRPGKSERMRFRKFVDKLKDEVQDEGAHFNMNTWVLPPTFNRNTHTRDKVLNILTTHQEACSGRQNNWRVFDDEWVWTHASCHWQPLLFKTIAGQWNTTLGFACLPLGNGSYAGLMIWNRTIESCFTKEISTKFERSIVCDVPPVQVTCMCPSTGFTFCCIFKLAPVLQQPSSVADQNG